MYQYETHLHTAPVSRCAWSDVEDSLIFYKELGYDGVFITNHFLDGNINVDHSLSYEEKIEFYFSDYEKGVALGENLGIKVFCGVELTYGGTDFLIYGLDKAWFLAHPEVMEMKKSEELRLMMESGALIIQAHPFREAGYIDHIRLFPRRVHGVEVINACRTEEENRMRSCMPTITGLLSLPVRTITPLMPRKNWRAYAAKNRFWMNRTLLRRLRPDKRRYLHGICEFQMKAPASKEAGACAYFQPPRFCRNCCSFSAP
jgi:hypothetical protein